MHTLAYQEDHHYANYLTDYLPGVVFRCQSLPSWTMLSISKASLQLTGYTPSELMNNNSLTYSSLIDADDRDRVWQEIQTTIRQNQHYENVYRINTKQGEQKWVWEKGFAEDGSSDIEGIIIDITEHKLAEIVLQESEARFHDIVDGSIGGILIHRDWQPLFINKSLLKLLGYDASKEVLALDSMSSLIAPNDRERVIGYAKALMKGESAPTWYEFMALHREGTLRSMEVKSSLIDWKGEPAILITLNDITQRKNDHQEIVQQRQQLAHASRLNILGEMTAGIAHELNQPLTAISNRCAAVRNRIDSDQPDLAKIREAVQVIEEQALRSGDIIKNLRSLVTTQNNQTEAIEVRELLESCLKYIKIEGLFRSTTICTDLSVNLPKIIGEPVQIQQLLLNLIRNASDAMQHLAINERQINVSAIQHDKNAVQISVSDFGKGISEANEAKLFQVFFTTKDKDKDKDKDKGMGMGLSICRTIIENLNGRLWFSRNSEQGVTFRFTLPIYLDK